MKSYSQGLGNALFSSSVQHVAELYEFRLGDGTRRWTTADTDITSGSTTWYRGGITYSSGTSGEVQSIPTTSSKGNASIVAGFSYTDLAGINASAGQTIYFAFSAQNQNGTGEAVVTPSFTVNGNGNTISEIVSATLAGYYAERIFTCSVSAPLTNATARFTFNNSEQRGAISYVVFSNVDPVQGNTKSVFTALGSPVNPVTASLTSTRASSSFIWSQKLGTNTPVGWTGSALLYSYQYCGNGLFTGSVTSPGQTVTVGVSDSSGPSWDYIFAIAEVRGNYSAGGIVYNETWSGPTIVRGPLRSPTGLEVASLELTLDPGTGSIGSVPMRTYALQGGFNDVRVVVSRSYSTSSFGDTTPGLITVFDGIITDVRVGSTEIRLTAMSVLDKIREPLPRRRYQQLCPYVFGDADCGATDTGSLAVSTTAWSASSVTVTASITGAYWVGGTVTFVSGGLSGTQRTITDCTSSAGQTIHAFTIFPPISTTGSAGEWVLVRKGCNKYSGDQTPGNPSCYHHNNVARFGGFNSVPGLLSTKT